jgi:deazaflavin-dependent oxidoreductase (nitroreductase family)
MSDSNNASTHDTNDAARFNDFNQSVIAEFRANAGVAMGGSPVLLLHHHGSKTGKEYTTPLVYTRDGDDYVIIASKGGAPTNPQWFANLVANPDVTIEVGTDTIPMSARVTEGDERARLYAAQAAQMSNFSDYAAATTREIPVVVLSRR